MYKHDFQHKPRISDHSPVHNYARGPGLKFRASNVCFVYRASPFFNSLFVTKENKNYVSSAYFERLKRLESLRLHVIIDYI